LPDKTPFFAAIRLGKKVNSNDVKKFRSQEEMKDRLLKCLTKSLKIGFCRVFLKKYTQAFRKIFCGFMATKQHRTFPLGVRNYYPL
jgi:hypothetical protein